MLEQAGPRLHTLLLDPWRRHKAKSARTPPSLDGTCNEACVYTVLLASNHGIPRESLQPGSAATPFMFNLVIPFPQPERFNFLRSFDFVCHNTNI